MIPDGILPSSVMSAALNTPTIVRPERSNCSVEGCVDEQGHPTVGDVFVLDYRVPPAVKIWVCKKHADEINSQQPGPAGQQ